MKVTIPLCIIILGPQWSHPLSSSVLGGVVLVLDTESLSGEVVGLALSTSFELWLVSLEVGLVLLHGHKGSLGTSTSFLSHVG